MGFWDGVKKVGKAIGTATGVLPAVEVGKGLLGIQDEVDAPDFQKAALDRASSRYVGEVTDQSSPGAKGYLDDDALAAQAVQGAEGASSFIQKDPMGDDALQEALARRSQKALDSTIGSLSRGARAGAASTRAGRLAGVQSALNANAKLNADYRARQKVAERNKIYARNNAINSIIRGVGAAAGTVAGAIAGDARTGYEVGKAAGAGFGQAAAPGGELSSI